MCGPALWCYDGAVPTSTAPPKIDYRLLNARNRVEAPEHERDHPGEFDHVHQSVHLVDGTVIGGLDKEIAKARTRLERLERDLEQIARDGQTAPK